MSTSTEIARTVKFLRPQDDPPPAPAVKLPRSPRDDEALAEFVIAVAKTLGLLRHDASLSAKRKEQLCEELLARAADDEVYGGAPAGKTLLAAAEAWRRTHPEIGGDLGQLAKISRDLGGRATRGVPRAVAVLLEQLAADRASAERLTPTEREILRWFAPELAAEVGELETQRQRRLARIAELVAEAQEGYPPGEPSAAVDRREPQAPVAPSAPPKPDEFELLRERAVQEAHARAASHQRRLAADDPMNNPTPIIEEAQ